MLPTISNVYQYLNIHGAPPHKRRGHAAHIEGSATMQSSRLISSSTRKHYRHQQAETTSRLRTHDTDEEGSVGARHPQVRTGTTAVANERSVDFLTRTGQRVVVGSIGYDDDDDDDVERDSTKGSNKTKSNTTRKDVVGSSLQESPKQGKRDHASRKRTSYEQSDSYRLELAGPSEDIPRRQDIAKPNNQCRQEDLNDTPETVNATLGHNRSANHMQTSLPPPSSPYQSNDIEQPSLRGAIRVGGRQYSEANDIASQRPESPFVGNEDASLVSARVVDAVENQSETCCQCWCGIDISKRTHKVVAVAICLLAVAFAVVAVVLATSLSASRGSNPAANPISRPPTSSSPVVAPPSSSPTPDSTVSRNPTTPTPISPQPTTHDETRIEFETDIAGGGPGVQLGFSIAFSSVGDVIAIGSEPKQDGENQVSVYGAMGGEWALRGDPLDGMEIGDWFGSSVSLSADGIVLAVGARRYGGVNGIRSGGVLAFEWNAIAWVPMGLPIDGEADDRDFGCSVALSNDGRVLAAGAFRYGGGGTNIGRARIFEWNSLDWVLRGSPLDGESIGDASGWSVSLSSDGAIVGSGSHHSGANVGHVRVFRWTGTLWSQLGTSITGQGQDGWFGFSVSLSGDGTVVAIGAGMGNYCQVFEYNGTDWIQRGQTLFGEAPGDLLGESVAISSSGETLVVGGPWNADNGFASGHARVFRLTPSNLWMQVGNDLDGESRRHHSGRPVAISKDASRIAVGSRFSSKNGPQSGHVRIYKLI